MEEQHDRWLRANTGYGQMTEEQEAEYDAQEAAEEMWEAWDGR